MADIGTLIMKVQADTDNFERGMNRVDTSVSNTARNVGIAIATISAAVVAGGAQLISMASDAEEMQNKFDVVFSGMENDVEAWADEYSDAVGRSRFDTMEYLANLADLQMGLGMTQEEAFSLASQIVELGTDLASFNNLQDATAIEALSKALLGEAESAKQLGLLLNVERVKDYAEAQGLVYEELSDAERAQVIFNLAVEQSQNALGDAERSQDSFENQMKELKSTISDTATEIGLTLLPKATELVTWINDTGIPGIMGFAESFPTLKQKASEAFNGLVEASEPYTNYLSDTFEPVLSSAEEWFLTNMPTWKENAKTAWDGIKEGAVNYVSYLADTYSPVMQDTAEWFISKMPEWKESAKTAWSGIKEVMQPTIDTVRNDLLPAFDDIRVGFIEMLPGVATELESLFEQVAISLGTVATVFNETLGGTIKEEIQNFRDQWPELKHDVQTTIYVIIALLESMVEALGIVVSVGIVLINNFADTFRVAQTIVSGAFSLMKNDGKSFKEKLISYMESVGTAVFELSDNFGTAGTTIFNFFADFGEKAVETANTVIGAITSIQTAISNLLSSSVNVDNLFYGNVPSSLNINTHVQPDNSSPYNTTVTGQNANGGNVKAGNAYLIGERGVPELFIPNQDGAIVPIGGNVTIQVNGTGNPEMVANQIVKILKMQGVRV